MQYTSWESRQRSREWGQDAVLVRGEAYAYASDKGRINDYWHGLYGIRVYGYVRDGV